MTAHHFQTVRTYWNKQKWNQMNTKTKTQKKTKKKNITTVVSNHWRFEVCKI